MDFYQVQLPIDFYLCSIVLSLTSKKIANSFLFSLFPFIFSSLSSCKPRFHFVSHVGHISEHHVTTINLKMIIVCACQSRFLVHFVLYIVTGIIWILLLSPQTKLTPMLISLKRSTLRHQFMMNDNKSSRLVTL